MRSAQPNCCRAFVVKPARQCLTDSVKSYRSCVKHTPRIRCEARDGQAGNGGSEIVDTIASACFNSRAYSLRFRPPGYGVVRPERPASGVVKWSRLTFKGF